MEFLKFFRKLSSSQAGGAELIGVIVASAIGAIIIASNTQMFAQMARSNKDLGKMNAALDLKREIEALLTDPDACRRNFRNLLDNGVERTAAFVDAGGEVKYSVGQVITAQGSTGTPGQFESIKLTKWALNDGIIIRTSATAPARKVVELTLFLDKNDGSGEKSFVRSIKIHTQKMTIDPDSAIDRCYAIVGNESDIWIRDVSGNNIYNSNAGNVGIGTIAPTQKLHVIGNMRATGNSTAQTFDATGSFTTTGPTSVIGNTGLGTNAPAEKLHVVGNFLTGGNDGNLTVGGAASAATVAIQNNLQVGGTLGVAGHTSLSSTSTGGAATFGGTSTFAQGVVFGAPVSISPTLGVNYGALPLGTSLGIGGNVIVTGTVTANRVNASSRYCIGADCRDTFATQSCPVGQVAFRNNANGTVDCVSVSCPANTFFQGISGGAPVCRALPTPTCPTDSYITNYDAVTGAYNCAPIPPQVQVSACPNNSFLMGVVNGVAQCQPLAMIANVCGPGLSLIGINPDGSFSCGNTFPAAADCPAGTVLYGINSDGSPQCRAVAIGGTCSGNGIRMASINGNGTPNCGNVSVIGGSCGNGVVSIGNNGSPGCAP